MKSILAIVSFLLHLMFVLAAWAGPRDHVAVAEAVVWASQTARPVIPSDQYQTPTPLTAEELSVKQDEQIQDLLESSKRLGSELVETYERLNAANLRLIQYQIANTADVHDDTRSHVVAEWPGMGPTADPSMMRLELPMGTTPLDHPPLPAQIVLESIDLCIPCRRNKQEILKHLQPVGWEIGDAPDSHIRFIQGADPNETYPKITLYQRGQVMEVWRGYQDPSFLSHRLRAAWDAADEPVRTAVAHGTAGTFHIKPQVRHAVEFLRKYIGTGKTLSLIWDRSEARLNLLAGLDFKPRDLWGLSGRIQLDSPNAVQLPVKSFATSYQLIGNDVRFSPEPFNVIGLANEIGAHHLSATYTAIPPAQLLLLDDSLLIYSVVQMIRDVVALLHPSADIILPDQIVCHVSLDGDTITVRFDKSPTVCLKWLFTFNLAVQRVTVDETKVQMDFSGSRFVKSREFDVR